MGSKFLEVTNVLSSRKTEDFLARTNSEIEITTNIKQVVRDFSWIEKLEQTIPYIDTIVRNPRKFIVSEEEIIPVEKTRKVTEESIKHLAKHTSLIQDIDEDGSVKPLKLLNVFKEETTDLYENRFIYSLIVNTKTFLNNQLENYSAKQKSEYCKSVNYKGHTRLSTENLSFEVNIKNDFAESSDEASQSFAYEERIKRINEIFSDFLATQFIKSLSGSTPVRSPIRKTNVILKDKSFIKAVELWEFIEKYDPDNATQVVEKEEKTSPLNLNDKMDVGVFLFYEAFSNQAKDLTSSIEYKFSVPYLRKIIENYVNEFDLDEKKFKNLVNKEFQRAKHIKEELYNEIKKEYNNNLESHNDRVKKSLAFLD